MDDPCKEGRHQCGPNSNCVVEGDTFRCACAQGYQYIYEDDANGERATCIGKLRFSLEFFSVIEK